MSSITPAIPRPASKRAEAIANTLIGVALVLATGYLLAATGLLQLAQTALGDQVVDPPNIAGVKTAANTIKGNIVAYVLLVLPAMVIFAGACVLVGLRLGQDLLGKVAGGLVILVALSPALLA